MDDMQSVNNAGSDKNTSGGGGPHRGDSAHAAGRPPAYSKGAAEYPNIQEGSSREGSPTRVILRILLRRWITVLLLGVAGGLVGIIYLMNCTPIYKATAEIEMSVRRPRVINSEAVYDDLNSSYDEDIIFNTRFAKFKSPAMEGLASKEYVKRYPEHTTTLVGKRINSYTLAIWIRRVSWYKDPSANIVYVMYSDADPKFAAQLVNTLTDCAGILMMRENQAQSDEAVKWLVTQVQEQRDKLEEVEKELAVLREELQLDSLEQQKVAIGQALLTVSEEKELLVSELGSRNTIHTFVAELIDTDPNMEMLPPGLPKERELNELIRAWRTSHDDLLLAADRYTELHPEYRKAAELEARSRQRLELFITISAKAVQNEIELLKKRIEEIEHRISAMKTDAIQLEQALANGLQQLQRLERKRDAADISYQAMLRRMEEARLSADEDMAFTKIIRRARVPQVPERPRKPVVMLFSTFMGLAAGALFVILGAFWSDKIYAVADLKALDLHILASIPSQKKNDARSELATIGLRDKFSSMVEIFAGINALLSSGRFANQSKVLLMCSGGPGEGKTISACNLAVSSAINGARTLLIDGDLRRPQLTNIFDIDDSKPSLLEWLSSGESELTHEQLISQEIIEGLDVITSRPSKDTNPAELLGRRQLAELINWARDQYDRVIIDSPPLALVGDAQVYGNLSDAVIVVARVGKTKRRAIKFSLKRFQEIGTPVAGCIANDVPHSLVGMFGGAEGYGYAYGYNSYNQYSQQ